MSIPVYESNLKAHIKLDTLYLVATVFNCFYSKEEDRKPPYPNGIA